MKFKADIPPKDIKNNNPLTSKILETNFSSLDQNEFQELYLSLQGAEAPVLDEEKVSKILEHILSQFPKDFISSDADDNLGIKKELLWSVLDYISNFKEKDKKTNETTLDRSFRSLFNLAEKYPVGVYESMTRTHHLFEFVKPEIFYETLIKIQDSKELDKLYSGHLFSQLEYNISYCGTENYINALINKINFKDSKSCLISGRLMNFAVSLADYANSGSYSGNYDVGERIIKALEEGAKDPNSIYLLSSKAEYMAKRIKNELPPLVHREQIFKPTENTIAMYDGSTLLIDSIKEGSGKKIDDYNLVNKELSTPPKELVDQAIANGQDYVEWEPPRELRTLQKKLTSEISRGLRPINSNDLSPSQNIEISISDIKEYSFLIGSDFRLFIEKEFEISLAKLNMKEQFYLFLYFQKQTKESMEKVKKFSSSYREPGLKTFFSISYGGKEMGDNILILGEKLPEESAKALFKTYGDMVDATEEVGTLLSDNLGEKATPDLINEAKEALLLGGKKLLENYALKASTCNGVECENLGKELEEHLSLARTSVFAFSYACKTLVERGEFTFEDFKKVKLSYDRSPIPEEMQKQIITMHHENTKQYPDALKEKWRGTLKEGLEKENPKQMVVSVSYDNNIVSAMRVIEQEDGSWYGASFNVNPTVMGSRIGSELLKKVIEDLAQNKPFVADCYAENPMLKTYIEKFGFEITKTYENYQDTGVKVYQITLFPKKKE